MNIKNYIATFTLFILMYSCTDREVLLPIDEMSSEQSTQGNAALNTWIKTDFINPYNISVKYHWDSNIQNFVVGSSSLPTNSKLLPASEKKVPVLLGAIKYLWIDTWSLQKTGGEDFIKKYAPREIYLFDGPSFVNIPYKERLNIFHAEGFNPRDPKRVQTMLAGLLSNYIKMLVQKKPFDRAAFSRLNLIHRHSADSQENNVLAGEYGGLGNYTLYRGLFTSQSNISIEEDFVGTAISILTHSKSEIDDAIKKAGTVGNVGSDPVQIFEETQRAENAKKTLTDKKEFVSQYFEENYHINLSTLQFFSTIRIKKYLSSYEEFTPKF